MQLPQAAAQAQAATIANLEVRELRGRTACLQILANQNGIVVWLFLNMGKIGSRSQSSEENELPTTFDLSTKFVLNMSVTEC